MLKRLEVKHFKSLDDFSIDFEPLTVLIGQNASGKTTVLQALDLLGAFLRGDVNYYLKEIGWTYSSSLSSKSSKYFGFEFALFFEAEGIDFRWEVHFYPAGLGLRVDMEELVVINDNFKKHNFFSFSAAAGGELWSLRDSEGQPIELPEIEIEFRQSILRAFKIKKNPPKEIEIAAKEIEKIFFYNLDSTDSLRRFSEYQAEVENVGRGGEFLGSYLFSLVEHGQADELNAQLARFIPQIKRFNVRNDSGRIVFSVEEKFPNGSYPERNFEIFQDHINEGTLRLLSLLAMIQSVPQGGILLLDEIENAVDPNRLGLLVEYLEAQIKEKDIQIILATHSPVIVNYISEKGIRYFSREASGNVVVQNLFERGDLQSMLKYMNPGEVWLNLDHEELIGGN